MNTKKLITLTLSPIQAEMACKVIESFDTNQVVLANLCARFGKTVWSAAVATEREVDLLIVASYVKTVFSSFAKDLTTFEQFADYVHVSCEDKDYQTEIAKALKNGQKVVAYLSLANGLQRQSRIDFLLSRTDVSTMLIVDEADFGAHGKKQADPLKEAVEKNTDVKVLIMTGTNADRATCNWRVDDMIDVTYLELLEEKAKAKAIINQREKI
jgi:hypothetical protein